VITLSGSGLTPAQVLAIADGEQVDVDQASWATVAQARRTMIAAIARRPVYGRTTGVGANNSVRIYATELDDTSGLRLLRSHAGGAGAQVGRRPSRAMLAIRANQLLAGAAGVAPDVIAAMVAAVNAGAWPRLHEFGSVGTGDLTALAELALTLIGERPWIGSRPPALAIDSIDALAVLSSSALTIAQATLAYCDLARLADAATVVAALSFTALQGSPEPFAPEVQAARPHPGAIAVAARMRALTEPVGAVSERVQDPYGLRALAPVHGVALESLERLRSVLAIELNAGAENPLVSVQAGDVFHHGNFHQAPLAAALDAARLAVLSSAQLGAARLGALLEPQRTGLSPFLADGPAGSSGLMITEYTTASALAELRSAAAPVTGGNSVLSRGVEEHESFAPQGARQTTSAAEAYRIVIATELVAAVRALRMSNREPRSAELGAAYATAAAALPVELADRSIDADIAIAAGLLDSLGRAESSP
jgi:histidine ammonia-lyase